MSTSEADAQAIRASLHTTRHRDPAMVRASIERWLGAHGGGRVTGIAAPGASGASSELFMLDLEDAPVAGAGKRGAVLRILGAQSVYPVVDPEQQFLCQRLIADNSHAPVPQAFGLETDPATIGAPFILMERAAGRGAPDWPSYVAEGWLNDLPADDRAALWRHAVAAIVAVHDTDLSGVDQDRLRLPTPGDSDIERLVAYWQLYHDVVSRDGSYPVLDHAIAWLVANRPRVKAPSRMLWGDASLRNMLFEGLTPSALLDLEFAHIGVAAFDIAFFAMMDRVMAEGYAGIPRLSGFPDEDETFDLYEQLSGGTVEHRAYFCRMAVTYMALANTRVFQRLAAEGRMPTQDVGRNPPLRFLAGMFGLSIA